MRRARTSVIRVQDLKSLGKLEGSDRLGTCVPIESVSLSLTAFLCPFAHRRTGKRRVLARPASIRMMVCSTTFTKSLTWWLAAPVTVLESDSRATLSTRVEGFSAVRRNKDHRDQHRSCGHALNKKKTTQTPRPKRRISRQLYSSWETPARELSPAGSHIRGLDR
jgi:hypothetical protein